MVPIRRLAGRIGSGGRSQPRPTLPDFRPVPPAQPVYEGPEDTTHATKSSGGHCTLHDVKDVSKPAADVCTQDIKTMRAGHTVWRAIAANEDDEDAEDWPFERLGCQLTTCKDTPRPGRRACLSSTQSDSLSHM